jgi:hypothetical protein
MNLSLEYLAGLVDGEGCIRLHPSNKGKYRKYYPRLQVTNTYKPILDMLVDQYGGAVHSDTKSRKENWKVKHDWRITGDKARELLNQLLPYLIIKKEKAIEVLQGDQKFKEIHNAFN